MSTPAPCGGGSDVQVRVAHAREEARVAVVRARELVTALKILHAAAPDSVLRACQHLRPSVAAMLTEIDTLMQWSNSDPHTRGERR